MNTPTNEEVDVNQRQYIPIPQNGFGDSIQVNDRTPQPVLRLHIVGPLLIYSLILLTYTALGCVYGLMGMNELDFKILVTIEIVLIPATAALESWLRHVNEQRRALGFFKFSNQLRQLLLFPTYILLYILGAFLLRLCWGPEFKGGSDEKREKSHYVFSAFLIGQSLGMLGILIALYVKVLAHNSSQLLPDYYYFVIPKRGEDYVDSRIQGWGQGQGYNEGLGQGQGQGQGQSHPQFLSEGLSDVIEYLSRHNHRLCKEVSRLRSALDSNEFWDPKYVQDVTEMKNNLEAAHQRVRVLEIEKEHMSERFAATGVELQQREDEIFKLKQSQVQFMEEYQRLRESLEEWSNRNAKLERKYNQIHQQRKGDQENVQKLEQQIQQLKQQLLVKQLQEQQQQQQIQLYQQEEQQIQMLTQQYTQLEVQIEEEQRQQWNELSQGQGQGQGLLQVQHQGEEQRELQQQQGQG